MTQSQDGQKWPKQPHKRWLHTRTWSRRHTWQHAIKEKNESDEYVTIGDINIMSEMNMSNRESENAEDKEKEIRTIKDKIYDQDQKMEYNLH